MLGRGHIFCSLLLASIHLTFADEAVFSIGFARIDISPEYPVRLSGFVSRKTESEGVAQKIWAKAMAIRSGTNAPAVLISVDTLGLSQAITDEVSADLRDRRKLPRENIAICSSHTHGAPCLSGVAPNIFAQDIPQDQQDSIDRYTRDLTAKLKQVAEKALDAQQPSIVTWGEGTVDFALNRRTKGGPVDHALPILKITDPRGNLRGIVANYACHCTTLGGEFNRVHGDWSGDAQESFERDHPGAMALQIIGCGADANPSPRGKIENVHDHGRAIAQRVSALIAGPLTELRKPLECRLRDLDLSFDPLPSREQWEQRARQTNIVGYHARKNLKRLAAGEKLPESLAYRVQSWNFGDQLELVFLAGEVVVDYDLRLKQEFDPNRLWVIGYANFVPCYIPSKRILREGGYEAEESLWYYDRPARLAPGLEDQIIGSVKELAPARFKLDPKRTEFPPPKSPDDSLATIQTRPELEVRLVAAEPLIVDPVAIDWSADGRLWVVEMRDFPMGMDGKWKPGGRIRVLEDIDGDGRYDKATTFLDEIPFPTGITAWGKGVLICAAPDILYAEDTDGDGKADLVRKMFSGFVTENYQARVNSLTLGLDNWIYGANGLIGGAIKGAAQKGEVNIRGRDFRFRFDTGEFEPAAGLTQQGRVRDDYGNWFGCDNSTLLMHYPLPDHYLRRNPYVTYPDPKVHLAAGDDPNQLFPISRTLKRFNDPGSFNRVTSACGLGLYRDSLLNLSGNAFICEPVHNLVRRLVLEPDGLTFRAIQTPDEQRSEFLAAKDNWFRPVQVRTGPDGALWVVDMYRFVVEHPRWITPERLAELDLRAGDDKGRIYKVVARGSGARPIRDLTKLSLSDLVAALESPNGTERDRIQIELLQRRDLKAILPLKELFSASRAASTRVQALSILSSLGGLSNELAKQAFADPAPEVRQMAILLSENTKLFSKTASMLADDPDLRVRYQLALTIGGWPNEEAGEILTRLLQRDLGDRWMAAAILSSAKGRAVALARSLLPALAKREKPAQEIFPQLIATAAATSEPKLDALLAELAVLENGHASLWQLETGATILNILPPNQRPALQNLADQARDAVSTSRDEELRATAIGLLGYEPVLLNQDLASLGRCLEPDSPSRCEAAAVRRMASMSSPLVANEFLSRWATASPALRQQFAAVLLNREEWTNPLLEAVEKGSIARVEISVAQRQKLLKHSSASIRERASALWKSTSSGERAAALKKFEAAASLMGDPKMGSVIFDRSCATCHLLGGKGFAVGPNLAALTDKSFQFLLTAIVTPNAAVEDRYIGYSIETKDGRSAGGIIAAESGAGLTLLNAGGVKETLLRSEIAQIRASSISLMPEGLEQGWSLQDMADLISFITGAR